jgi:hypothetical protein
MAAAGKKPVMDVSKPGTTPADATTRPIISGHAVMKDPMVNPESDKEDATDALAGDTPKEALAPSASHKVIQPMSASETKPEKDAETPAAPSTVEKDTPDTEITEDAVVDAVLDQVNDKKKEDAVSAEEEKRQELVDKLVEEKKYFLPINQAKARRKSKFILIVVAALLPVVVGLGLAADAGAINLGFKVPFDFIKDQPSQTSTDNNQAAVQPVPTTKTYSDTTKGFSFEYPIEWGDVAINKGVYPKTLQGTYYRITFSKNATLFGALQTKDFISNTKATDPISFYPTGSYDYDTTVASLKSIDAMRGKPRAATAAIPGVAVLKSNGEWMTLVQLCSSDCTYPKTQYIVGSLHKLDTKDFSAISFGYTDEPSLPNGITYLGLMDQNADSITKLIDQKKLDQLEKFTASIKSIKQ